MAFGKRFSSEGLVSCEGFWFYLCSMQGAQAVGMGSEVHTIPAAAALYSKANEILGYGSQLVPNVGSDNFFHFFMSAYV